MLQVNQRGVGLVVAIFLTISPISFAQELSDPTMPPRQLEQRNDSAQKSSSSPRLQSIQFIGSSRSALINGQRLYQGERFENYVVEKIDLNFVTLRDQQTEQRLTLRLFELAKESVKTSGNNL
ncbi:hypothetical protein [Pseudidiomarina woesei]|uniref:MSHA biogenesis protein MshK n=1 Tax=Pseudidiomarina woesei TaxID=1381080 RepID=A0A0K6H824_9GAMM|nr:hypothetical protein [Pseudidiomarina woesei]CUA87049.1 hypothetical protein Ga0061064_1702 [Pseudidiomarina woesei]